MKLKIHPIEAGTFWFSNNAKNWDYPSIGKLVDLLERVWSNEWLPHYVQNMIEWMPNYHDLWCYFTTHIRNDYFAVSIKHKSFSNWRQCEIKQQRYVCMLRRLPVKNMNPGYHIGTEGKETPELHHCRLVRRTLGGENGQPATGMDGAKRIHKQFAMILRACIPKIRKHVTRAIRWNRY